MKKLTILASLLISCITLSAQKNFFEGSTDTQGWFSFNNQRNYESYKRKITLTSPENPGKTPNMLTFVGFKAKGTPQFEGKQKVENSQIMGAICLAPSRQQTEPYGVSYGEYLHGGSVTFELPSCSTFELYLASESPKFLSVATSKDGVTFKTVSEPKKGKPIGLKGHKSYDISSMVQSKEKIWVKLTNGSGVLFIHKVRVIE